jgi:hypothetical protein
MNLSYVHKLLLAADPFSAMRTNFRNWKWNGQASVGKPKRSRARHLTCKQRETIAAALQDSTLGPVSMTAAAGDNEAVSYENEIANVLEETGFDVKIDNPSKKEPSGELPAGVEMTIKEGTVRPIHALHIVNAFRRAGVTIATKISALRRKNNTLYISVGLKESPLAGPASPGTAAAWQSKSMALVLAKWRDRFLR